MAKFKCKIVKVERKEFTLAKAYEYAKAFPGSVITLTIPWLGEVKLLYGWDVQYIGDGGKVTVPDAVKIEGRGIWQAFSTAQKMVSWVKETVARNKSL